MGTTRSRIFGRMHKYSRLKVGVVEHQRSCRLLTCSNGAERRVDCNWRRESKSGGRHGLRSVSETDYLERGFPKSVLVSLRNLARATSTNLGQEPPKICRRRLREFDRELTPSSQTTFLVHHPSSTIEFRDLSTSSLVFRSRQHGGQRYPRYPANSQVHSQPASGPQADGRVSIASFFSSLSLRRPSTADDIADNGQLSKEDCNCLFAEKFPDLR